MVAGKDRRASNQSCSLSHLHPRNAHVRAQACVFSYCLWLSSPISHAQAVLTSVRLQVWAQALEIFYGVGKVYCSHFVGGNKKTEALEGGTCRTMQ